ncbi:hypothetical protein ACGH7X_35620 [Streptomyces sp. BBFR51]|uniref:hypothetical protein n=1 Tax=Streptomyces sp. BBFR51 TaxID=3372856 RepID=UPI0037DC2C78
MNVSGPGRDTAAGPPRRLLLRTELGLTATGLAAGAATAGAASASVTPVSAAAVT